jgi:nucleotide-binding universal stress UspA family protein
MFQRILVPLDGSEHAERAIPVAARIARATGGALIFINVVFSPAEVGYYSFETLADMETGREKTRRAQAEDYLTYTVKTAYAHELVGIPTERDVEIGAAAPTIFATALLERVDLIVMCSRGETGLKRWVFGSVASDAVQRAPVPVLILHEEGVDLLESTEGQLLRVLVPLDGTPLAEMALEPAIQFISALAAPKPAAIHLLRVVDVPSSSGKYKGFLDADAYMRKELQQEANEYLKQVKGKLHNMLGAEYPLLVTSSVVINPSVAKEIVEVAEREEELKGGCTMIAMATHGRMGLHHLLMGSVTKQVLDHTDLPLLVIHTHKQEASSKVGATQ